MQASAVLPPSPSLSGYSTGKFAEIAARVVDELGLDSDPFCFDSMNSGGASTEQSQPPGEEAGGEESDSTQFDNEDVEEAEEEEEEFAFVCGGPGSSPIPADEIFYNGQIRPVYPVFDRDLLLNGVSRREKGEDDAKKVTKLRLPLKKLLSEDREWTSSSSSSSSSSSESDELDGLAPGSYCVWRPKPSRDQPSAAAATRHCGKSSSTGSPKRWRFKDLLLNRSNSSGKDRFLLVTPSKKRDNKIGESNRVVAVAEDDGGGVVTAPDENKTAGKDEDKRKPLLPQRADLVGFFATANGLSRNMNLHPF